MSLNLTAIREALADQIQGGISEEISCFPYNTPKTGTCVVIREPDQYVGYYETFGTDGLADVQLLVDLIVSAQSEDAQRLLDEMRSVGLGMANSVVDAIHADKTLNGTVDTCIVRSATGTQAYGPDGSSQLVSTLPIEIVLSKGGAE